MYKYLKTHIVNRYSRIFHHIETKDLKRKQRENIMVQRIKEQEKEEVYRILKENEEYIERNMQGQRSNWRDDLTDA